MGSGHRCCQPGRSFGRATGPLGLAENARLGGEQSGSTAQASCLKTLSRASGRALSPAIKRGRSLGKQVRFEWVVAWRNDRDLFADPVEECVPITMHDAASRGPDCAMMPARHEWRWGAVVIERRIGDGGLVARRHSAMQSVAAALPWADLRH